MAGERKITVSFDGKDVGLGSAVADVEADLDRVDRAGRDAAAGFDTMGEAGDTAEQRFMGVADTMTGVQDSMAGFKQLSEGDVAGGLLTMTMGFADLASGVSNLIAPFASQVAAWVTGRATMATADVAGAAASNTSWFSMAATSLASAAQVALAWLISMGPILLVIAAVVGLVIIIVKNWDTIKRVIQAGWEWVKQITSTIWNGIKAVVGAVVGAMVDQIKFQINIVMSIFRGISSGIKSALSTVSDAITAPFRIGFSAIKDIWNNTVGGKGFSVPSWVPGVGGKEFRIPKLHSGGVFRSNMLGGEGLALLRDGERVLTPNQALTGGGSDVVQVTVMLDGQVILDGMRRAVKRAGGLAVAFS